MANLRIPIDSYLRRFELFNQLDNILNQYDMNHESDSKSMSLEESTARSNYYKFLDLAMTMDNFSTWTDNHWTNFLMCMTQAYKEKGKIISLNCALAALGIQVTEPISLEDRYEDGVMKSIITMKIDTMQTPTIYKFLERLENVLGELLWLHDPDLSNCQVNLVLVRVNFEAEYIRTVYTYPLRYSKIDID